LCATGRCSAIAEPVADDYRDRCPHAQGDAMIVVIATIEVAAGRREEFLQEFRRVVPLVLNEEGCIEYWPMIDVATGIAAQGPLRDDVVTIVEKWDSLPALQAHLSAPHMHEYRGRVKDLVQRVSLQVVEPV
jgi:quinol monooxygenase YgiN